MERLFGAANAKRKEANWKHRWVKNGNILVRKEDKSPIASITHLDDLAVIV